MLVNLVKIPLIGLDVTNISHSRRKMTIREIKLIT